MFWFIILFANLGCRALDLTGVVILSLLAKSAISFHEDDRAARLIQFERHLSEAF
jgi:hypothetical protein